MLVSDVNLRFYSDTSYHNEELKSLSRNRFEKVKERAQLKWKFSHLNLLIAIRPVEFCDTVIHNHWQNWDAISPIFKFSTEVRKVIYTTNAIESLNATYRKLNRQRSVFPSDTALLKALYLSTFEATKKWTMPIRNWGQVYGELSIMYEGRLPE